MSSYEFEGKRPRVDTGAFVHPEAVLIGEVIIEAGCYIGAGAVLRGDIGSIHIGSGSNIQENCVLPYLSRANRYACTGNTHIGHGCILHGCEIESQVLIGMGAIIADGVVIHDYCIIGAGSFVPFNLEIPSGSLVVGSPAKVLKTITPEQREQIVRGLGLYQELTTRYLKSFNKIR